MTHSGTWSWRPPAGEMRWSDGMYRLLGLSAERVLPTLEAFIGTLHLDDKTLFLMRLEEAVKKGEPLVLEHRITRPDGSVRRVHTEAACFVRGTPEEHWAGVMQDRTEVEAGEQTRRIVEALPDAFWLRTLDFGETLYVSAGYEHLWGRSRDELFGNPRALLQSIVPEDLAGLGTMLACQKSGCPYEAEYRIRHASGAVRWIRERGHPLRDAQGAVWAMAGCATDLTEPKQEAAELQESELYFQRLAAERSRSGEQLQRFLDNLPAMIVWHDAQGGVRFVNRTFEREVGWSGADLGERELLAELFPDPGYRAEVLACMNRGAAEWRDFRVRTRAGESRDLAWAYVRLDDGSYLGVGIDIHERRNMERRLRESEAKFRSVYDSNAVPFMFWRIDGRVVEANDAYLNLIGYTREDLTAGLIDRVDVTAQEFRARDEHVLGEQLAGKPIAEPFEKELLRKDGTRVPVLAGGALFPDRASGVSFAIDLSARKQAEDALRKLNAELHQAFADLQASQQRAIQIEKLTALGTLAAGVAHELNNPLMGVMNYVDYALRVAREPEATRVLTGAANELERMRDLLHNMLAFVRPVEEPLAPLAVDQVLERALKLLQPEFAELEIDTAFEIEADLPLVLAKEGQLQQVFFNLLMNARDAVAEQATRRIRIRARRHNDSVAIDVEDSGTGVSAGIQAQIFDPFFTTKPPGRGTGLGLSSARRVMLELGGDLTYGGEGAERGAVFTVRVPRARGET